MHNAANIISGLLVPGQQALDVKLHIDSEGVLSDLGPNNVLAYTYYKGMVARCVAEGTQWEWMPVDEERLEGKEGLLSADFTYPTGIVSEGISYSQKSYNFFPVDGDVDLSYEPKPDKGIIKNKGHDVLEIPLVDDVNAGLITPEQKDLIEEIENKADKIDVNERFIRIYDGVPGEGNTLMKLYNLFTQVKDDEDKFVPYDQLPDEVMEIVQNINLLPLTQEIFNQINQKLGIENVYNSLDQEGEGYVLDARQGKVLYDLIMMLGSDKDYTALDNEIIGLRNSSNISYTTPHAYVLGTSKVFVNGVRQERGLDYTEDANSKVLLSVALDPLDRIMIDYKYKTI